VENQLRRTLLNIAFFIFPTVFVFVIFNEFWYTALGVTSETFKSLIIVGYILTIVLIVIAYVLELCNLWTLAFGFLPAWIPVYIQESDSQGFMPYLGTVLVLVFYTAPMFVTSLVLVKVRDQKEKNYYMTPEDDSRQDEE